MLNELSSIIVSVVNALLLAAAPVLVVAVISAVVTFARKEWQIFKSAQPTIAEQVSAYARIAVEAAEQAGLAQLVQDKKIYAIQITSLWLQQIGLKGIDLDLIAAEIERQVGEMNKEKSALAG